MRVRNNEITCYRGETWTMSKKIVNNDNSPYIVSSELNNPYWLVQVSSSIYDTADRYILNKWLEIPDYVDKDTPYFPRFYHTQPYNIADTSFVFEDERYPIPQSELRNDKHKGYDDNYLFYQINEDGTISYKYWEYYNDYDYEDYSGHWVDYECKIITTFARDITEKWNEQNYLYSILLISGISTKSYLEDVAFKEEIDISGCNNILDLFNRLNEKIPEKIKDIDINKPILTVDETYEILQPTKLFVESNIRF